MKREYRKNRKYKKDKNPGRWKKVLLITGLIILLLIVSGWFALERITLVEPEWPAVPDIDPFPERPSPDDPPFHREPFAPTFEERREAYINWAAEYSAEGLDGEIILLEAGKETVDDELLQESIERLDKRVDNSDFTMNRLVRIYYKYKDRLSKEQKEELKRAFLDFRYWLDEPDPTDSDAQLFTENHQIATRSNEYLAGQLFPDETFTNVDRDGNWRKERAREAIENWIDLRSRTGLAEWNSITYYRFNLGALLNIIDFAEDEELVKKATMMTDLLLFDMVVDSYYGNWTTSHGRVSPEMVQSAANDLMINTQALLWGLGRFERTHICTTALATSENYDPPPVFFEIAHHHPEEITNLERHSFNVTEEDARRYGLDFESPESMKVWLSKGVFLEPQLLDLTFKVADEWNLWSIAGDEPLLISLARIGKWIDDITNIGILTWGIENMGIEYKGAALTEVNKITYRTPDYSLANAQSFRPGEQGYQQLIWRATLAPYAQVFVNNPGRMSDGRPGYWHGNGRLPRSAQHRNLLICLYDIDRHKGFLEPNHFAFTHAYFPRWAFDRVKEVEADEGGGWVFGEKDDGYVALYSHQPYRWREEGPDAGQEIIALGHQNVWICQMGRKKDDGSFDEFIKSVTNAPLQVDSLDVEFEAPGVGTASFGWDDPLVVDGEEIPLEDYPRWDNPYANVDFDSEQFTISHAGEELHLDFANNERTIR